MATNLCAHFISWSKQLQIIRTLPPGNDFSNCKIWFVGRGFFHAAKGDFKPNAFVDVVQEDLREKFHTRNREGKLQLSGHKEGNDHGVNAAGDTPGNAFNEAAIMFFGHKVIGIGEEYYE